jgi:hypothetical protein
LESIPALSHLGLQENNHEKPLLASLDRINVDSKLKRNFPVFVENFLGCSIPESLTWSIIDSLCDVENVTIRHESKF